MPEHAKPEPGAAGHAPSTSLAVTVTLTPPVSAPVRSTVMAALAVPSTTVNAGELRPAGVGNSRRGSSSAMVSVAVCWAPSAGLPGKPAGEAALMARLTVRGEPSTAALFTIGTRAVTAVWPAKNVTVVFTAV